MNSRRTSYLEMLIRVREFIKTHGIDFVSGSHASQQFNIINEVISELTEQNSQMASSGNRVKQDTSSKRDSRTNLSKILNRIRLSSDAIANTNPGFDEKFALPKNIKDQELLALGMAALSNAEPIQEEFFKREMEQDFIQKLRDAIDAYRQSLDSQAAGKNLRVKATAGAEPLLDKAAMAMKEMNAIMNNRYAEDNAILAEWDSARHPKQPATKKKPPAKKPTPEQPPVA